MHLFGKMALNITKIHNRAESMGKSNHFASALTIVAGVGAVRRGGGHVCRRGIVREEPEIRMWNKSQK